MRRTSTFQPHAVKREDRPDGTIRLKSEIPLTPAVSRTGDWLHHWADAAPDRTFLAERFGGGWREVSYAEALQKVRALGQALLGRGLNADTPIMILSGNGVDHGLLALAAQYVGVPAVPVAEQYSLIHGAHNRLRHVAELVRPKMAYTVNGDQYAEALALDFFEDMEILSSHPGHQKATDITDLFKGDSGVDVDAAFNATGPETIGKILMTSGSTSTPKGVPTTNRMMCVNQAQIADSLPFLRERPPRIVDWLPWNHVFGGSHNFNMMLSNGGSLYVDDGKPVKGLFDRTLENLSLKTGTLVFNVPLGFAMLKDALQKDETLRRRFFENLDLMFYAGASLPQDVWESFETMAMEVKGEIPLMTSSWGLTETGPATMMQQEPTERSGVVGVPMTGVTVKLLPDDEMRCEVRVKGPNIMDGYFQAPEKTAECFDEEGFFITGDAMSFVDPTDPNRGMKFEGRISEDFKLLTGTWVRAAALRADIISCLAPLASDVVITGQDKNEIGVMVFPDRAILREEGFTEDEAGGALTCHLLLTDIQHRLAERAHRVSGSSTLVSRALVLAEPPSIADGEITAKGNLNPRKVQTRRAQLLDRLYTDGDNAVCKI
ncbi:MAG: feruloyl-CoA synthase [Magnetospiraceae bacterium]